MAGVIVCYIRQFLEEKNGADALNPIDNSDRSCLINMCSYESYNSINHKNYNFLAIDWLRKVLFSTNSLAKLLSESLLLDSLLLDSLLSDSSMSQLHSKM